MTRVPHPTVSHVMLYDKSATYHRFTGKAYDKSATSHHLIGQA